MTEPSANSPTDDLWQAKALTALDQAVITDSGVPDGRRHVAIEIVITLMKAGLPTSDLHADAFEDRCGVALSVVPGPDGLQAPWRQHPHMETQADDVRGTQQSAMHRVLRTTLDAKGFWLKDQPAGEAPIIIAGPDPDYATQSQSLDGSSHQLGVDAVAQTGRRRAKGCPVIPGGRTTTATASRRVVGTSGYAQYPDVPPPCDAPHLTPCADPPGITGQPLERQLIRLIRESGVEFSVPSRGGAAR